MINGAIMNIKQLSLVVAVSALTFTTATNAVLGPKILNIEQTPQSLALSHQH